MSDQPLTVSPLQILALGRVPFREVWDRQRLLQQELMEGRGRDTLILCEHEPVITLGRSAKAENVLAGSRLLDERGIEVIPIERGGDVTYHGPGQLVAYPIIDLKRKRRDVGWYMRSLEQVVLRTLNAYGISAVTIPGKTGVWILPSPAPSVRRDRKIASMGVRISRWCTLHGLALNVFNCSMGFSLINPCGFMDIEATSLEQELSPGTRCPSVSEVGDVLRAQFFELFQYEAYAPNAPEKICAEA